MDNVLALDLGTTTGWAMISGGKIFQRFCEFQAHAFRQRGVQYTKFRRGLDGNHCTIFDNVVYEAVRQPNGTVAAQTRVHGDPANVVRG